jgi:SAM-dependent methyltransferase
MDSPGGYADFLRAKRALDERSLNGRLWQRTLRHIEQVGNDTPYSILEVGAGIGGMFERLWRATTRHLVRYTIVDVEPAHVAAFRDTIVRLAQCSGIEALEHTELDLVDGVRRWAVSWHAADVFEYLGRSPEDRFDLVIGQAFLDLFDLDLLVPTLVDATAPGGALYFPITFDGVSSWLPADDPVFDERVEHLYHASMDRRGGGTPRSRTGRHALAMLCQHPGLAEVDAGGSDWVIAAARAQSLQEGDRAFLQGLLDGYERELATLGAEAPLGWQEWVARRRRQVEENQAIFVSHQLDLFALRHF